MELKDINYNVEDNSYSDGFTTTFYQDFTIADKFGLQAIKGTYERCQYWKSNIRYWTDLCVVLNHKIYEWFKKDKEKAKLYSQLFMEADEFVFTTSNFTEEEKEFYVRITD